MMILACYGRGPADLHAQAFQDWIAAGFDANPDPELTLAVADFEDGPRRKQGLRWPKPLEALALAESDLRSALPLVAERRRGPVLKALKRRPELAGIARRPACGSGAGRDMPDGA